MNNYVIKKLVIGLSIFLCIGCSVDDRPPQSRMQIDSLEANLDAAEQAIDSLQLVIGEGHVENPWFNATLEGRILLQKGIKDPEAHIRQSLRENPQLIPLEPVLGGTMRFTNIQVLGSQWVIANYEDGHIMGRTIFEYAIEPGGDIRFIEIASTR